MALRELLVEGYRGVRFARLGLESSTVLVGENDCGKSSLLEALSIVLSPLDESLPSVARWQLHGAREAGVPSESVPLRVRVTLGESRAGSWDRPEASALVPVLGGKGIGPRVLTVEVTAAPQPAHGPVETHVVIRSPGGRPSRDDPSVLAAVRRLNPFVWLRGSALVRSPLRVPDGEVARDRFRNPFPRPRTCFEATGGSSPENSPRRTRRSSRASRRRSAFWQGGFRTPPRAGPGRARPW